MILYYIKKNEAFQFFLGEIQKGDIISVHKQLRSDCLMLAGRNMQKRPLFCSYLLDF